MTDASSTDKDQLIAELKAAVAARDEFIAIAAHELRNPMTPMVGQVQRLLKIAQRDGAPPAIATGLEQLEKIVQHYVKRATTLLEISRISAGRLQLEPETFDMSALIERCVGHYRPLAARAGSALVVSIAPDIRIYQDKLAVEQIADNLLSNAVKYGDGGTVTLKLSREAGNIVLTVADQGIGISAEDQRRIFDRFEQAIGQRSHGGFGIGLWIVRQLVEAMEGTITVESRLSEGSTFIVRLPSQADPLVGNGMAAGRTAGGAR